MRPLRSPLGASVAFRHSFYSTEPLHDFPRLCARRLFEQGLGDLIFSINRGRKLP